MIGVFFLAMFAGHIYIIGIVTAIQIISFKEVIAIANVPSRAKNLRFTRSLNWYFLGTTMYYLYGESVVYYFKHIVLVDKVLLPFATHHRFISFMLYVIGTSPFFPLPRPCNAKPPPSQASYSSWALSARATTGSSSPSSHGRTWPCT
jgi:CDP-diglyceride synthetase